MFRAGDHIHHKPTGEDWVLACDQRGDEVMCAGWPESIAGAEDCTLLEAATDEERLEMLRQAANTGGARGRWARSQLEAE